MNNNIISYEMSFEKFVSKVNELKEMYAPPEHYGSTELTIKNGEVYLHTLEKDQIKVVPGKEEEAYKRLVEDSIQAHLEGVMGKERMLTGEHIQITDKNNWVYLEMVNSDFEYGKRVIGIRSKSSGDYEYIGNEYEVSKIVAEKFDSLRVTYYDWENILNKELMTGRVTPITLNDFLKEHMNVPVPNMFIPKDLLTKQVSLFRTVENGGIDVILSDGKVRDPYIMKLDVQRNKVLGTVGVKLAGLNEHHDKHVNPDVVREEYGSISLASLKNGDELSFRNITMSQYSNLRNSGAKFAAFQQNNGTLNAVFRYRDTLEINQITKPKHLHQAKTNSFHR